MDSLGDATTEWILQTPILLEKLIVVWAEAPVIFNTNSPSFYEDIFDAAYSVLKERRDALHAEVSTGDGHCCMQMVIPVRSYSTAGT